ncbi:MAG: diacylglycerol kinase family protein [Peptococcaceae bacterium]|nr:diacylglycerol kinase family protein [Peptococcaceae bacterium]
MKGFREKTGRKKSLTESFVYAGRGLRRVLAGQRNMRIHLAVTSAVFVAAAWFKITPLETALIIFAVALVLSAEMLNTAIEKTVDLVTGEYHPLAAQAKDAAAGAVLLAAFFSVIIGALVFYPYVRNWFNGIFFK